MNSAENVDENRTARTVGFVLLLIATGAVMVRSLFTHENLNDDVFITLTYSKNLALGNGFVFNHPPATLGTTTPLLALILGFLGSVLPIPVDRLAMVLYGVCWAGVSWILWFHRRQFGLTPVQAGLAALAVGSMGEVLYGGEPALFHFLLVSAIAMAGANRWGLAGLTTGLLFLTRGEGVLLLPLLGLWSALRAGLPGAWKQPAAYAGALRLGSGFAAVAAAWSAYALWTFGQVLPNTLEAKVSQGRSADSTFIVDLIRTLPYWGSEGATLFYLSAAAWAFLVVGLSWFVWQNAAWRIYFLWIVGYVAGYAVLGVPGVYWWYRMPVYFAMALFAGLGMALLVDFARNRMRRRWAMAAAVQAAIVLLFIVPRMHDGIVRDVQSPGDGRGPLYKAVIEWLDENIEADDAVAIGEVGYLGYFSNYRIIDTMGLTMRENISLAEHNSYNHIMRTQPSHRLALMGGSVL